MPFELYFINTLHIYYYVLIKVLITKFNEDLRISFFCSENWYDKVVWNQQPFYSRALSTETLFP